MSPRTVPSMSSSVLAVLIGLTAYHSGPARAQRYGGDVGEYMTVRDNAPTCVSRSEPIPRRIASCTKIIDLAAHGSAVAKTHVSFIYVARATAFQQKGDDRAALQDLNIAAEKEPTSEMPWIALGNLHMAMSEYSQALQSYDRAQKVAADDPVVYDDRGAALASLGRNDEAIAAFARALALDPHDMAALTNRGAVHLSANHPALAIADLTNVIRAKPKSAMAFYIRGMAYERSNALDKAVEDYRSATRAQPSFVLAYEALGRVFAKDNPDAALSQLNEAIRIDPRSPALRSRAILYLSLSRIEPAIRDLDQVIANDGSDYVAYLDRGVAEQEQGNLKGALEDYSRSIDLETTTPALVDRGSVYEHLGEREKALADFDAALALEPNNVAALIGRADANYAPELRDAERLTASLSDYSRVIEVAPNNAGAYFMRGNIHFDLKDYAAAYSDYSESLALNPGQAAALFNRSLAAEHLGRSAEAAKDRRAARALNASIGGGSGIDSPETAAAATHVEYAAPRNANGTTSVAFATPRDAPVETAPDASSPSKNDAVTITGYRRMMVKGEALYCHNEATGGSRIAHDVCFTQQQIEVQQRDARRLKEDIQRWSIMNVMPSMCGGAMGGYAGSSCFGVSPFGGPGPNPFAH